MNEYGGKDPELLKSFMEELFDFDALCEVGILKKEMKGDYYAQAERLCIFFNMKSIYEYGDFEWRGHITYAGERPNNEPFITEIKSIYRE